MGGLTPYLAQQTLVVSMPQRTLHNTLRAWSSVHAWRSPLPCNAGANAKYREMQQLEADALSLAKQLAAEEQAQLQPEGPLAKGTAGIGGAAVPVIRPCSWIQAATNKGRVDHLYTTGIPPWSWVHCINLVYQWPSADLGDSVHMVCRGGLHSLH